MCQEREESERREGQRVVNANAGCSIGINSKAVTLICGDKKNPGNGTF